VIEVLVFFAAGAFGGLVRTLVEGKGLLVLPHVVTRKGVKMLNLGFLSSAVIGAAAGLIAPYSLGVDAVIALLAGFVGSHLIEHSAERLIGLPRGGG